MQLTKHEATCGDLVLGRERGKIFLGYFQVFLVGTTYNEKKENYEQEVGRLR